MLLKALWTDCLDQNCAWEFYSDAPCYIVLPMEYLYTVIQRVFHKIDDMFRHNGVIFRLSIIQNTNANMYQYKGLYTFNAILPNVCDMVCQVFIPLNAEILQS
jgi:hypothetical protein